MLLFIMPPFISNQEKFLVLIGHVFSVQIGFWVTRSRHYWLAVPCPVVFVSLYALCWSFLWNSVSEEINGSLLSSCLRFVDHFYCTVSKTNKWTKADRAIRHDADEHWKREEVKQLGMWETEHNEQTWAQNFEEMALNSWKHHAVC